MSESEQPRLNTSGSDDATDDENLAGLVQQVEQEHGEEGAAAMADHLRDRTSETEAEAEQPADAED